MNFSSLLDVGAEVFRNPEKEGMVTGGSYSGCAVLVRSGVADFATAVDTVGDLRVQPISDNDFD